MLNNGNQGLAHTNLAQYAIKVDGQAIEPWRAIRVVGLVVDLSLDGADLIEITFDDSDLRCINDLAEGDFGKSIEVSLGYGPSPAVVAKGVLVSVEPHFTASGQFTLTWRALGKISLLSHGRVTRTYLNQKDSDIASTIAAEVGLTIEADTTTVTYPYVVQWNQTNLEFLQERARRIGYRIWSDDSKLYFKKNVNDTSPVGTLSFGDEGLLTFRPRASLAQQVASVKVLGWNPQEKAKIAADATSPANLGQGGFSRTGNSLVSSKLNASTPFSVVDHILHDGSDAQGQADGILADLCRTFFEGEILVPGNPNLVPGAVVQVTNVGPMFSGPYAIATVRHEWTDAGFTSTIGISSASNERVGRILNGTPPSQIAHGVMPAIVTNIRDPEGMGRVKVKFPYMPAKNDAELESDWLRVAGPMSGNALGIHFVPSVNDEVLVAFEGGLPGRGYVIGSVWNGKDRVPFDGYQNNGAPAFRGIQASANQGLKFSIESGKESVTLYDKAGNTILLDSENQMLKITAVKDMQIDVGGDLTVKTQGKTSFESTGNFGIKSTSAVSIEGSSSVTVKSNATLSLQGTSAEVKATGSLSLSSSGIAELKGSLVKIN